MDNRERIIRLWFDMWLTKKDLGISDIFSNNAIYIESWGPEYHGIKKIILWFEELFQSNDRPDGICSPAM